MSYNRAGWVRQLGLVIDAAFMAAALLGTVALAVLALRAALRIETRWDAFAYHIPIAAKRGGVGVPFEMSDSIRHLYEGIPPLPEFFMGVLWRITGSINATGMINILALALFLFHCHRVLKASAPVVAILALTVPLVVIHAATNYVDLFGNCLLSVGATSLAAMMLFDRWRDRTLLYWGLAGLVAAAWTKMIVLPSALACLLCYLIVYGRHFRDRGFRPFMALVAGALLLALVPCAKNTVLYGNPLWPLRINDRLPYSYDPRPVHNLETPPTLLELSQPALFVHSVLEIGHPTEYAGRERWNIDQGNAWIAFRSGGFWYAGVITAATAAILLAFLFERRKGWMLLAMLCVMWGFVSVLPQSHELRYFMFLPLTTAAVIGMLLPRIRRAWPEATLLVLTVLLGEFSWMTSVNLHYYRVERVDYRAAADFWGISAIWPKLQPGQTYCAVGYQPVAFFLTGPTMKEFHIIDRPDSASCPSGVAVLRNSNPRQ